MPLYNKKHINTGSQLAIWKITEPLDQLASEVQLNSTNEIRFAGMKSEMHQRAFLSVRKLMGEFGYTDFDLSYDEFGKPNLNDGKHISITHSHNFSAILISDQYVGIDIELARDKIIRIADKFAVSEMRFLNASSEDYIQKLTVIWGIKESIFKIRNEAGISFKDNISVLPFEMKGNCAIGNLDFNGIQADFDIGFETFEDFVLVYAFYAQPPTHNFT